MTVNDNYEESYPANRVEDWLAKASAEQLKGWIAGGPASLPEQMSPTWHGRALRLLSALLPALTYLRDHGARKLQDYLLCELGIEKKLA